MTYRKVLIALALVLSCIAALRIARADDCGGISLRELAHGARWVELRHEKGQWQARIAPGAWQALPGLERYAEHGHLNLVQGSDAFAVIDSGSETDEKAKILVYDRQAKLLKSWDLGDFMKPADLQAVRRSISHLQWLAWEGGHDLTLSADGRSVALELLSGRKLTLALGATLTLR